MDVWIAVLVSIICGFVVSGGLGFVLVPWLHNLKFGQTILDIGPSWHKKKQGTPTMGGFLFIIGFAVSMIVTLAVDKLMGGDILTYNSDSPVNVVKVKIFGGIIMAVSFGFIGFIDDYIKVVKKRNLGLTELQKTILELLVMLTYLFTLYKNGVNYMFVPFFGMVENSIVFWVIGVIAIYATVNAVNFTDGVDGLCSSVTAIFCVSACVCAVLLNYTGVSIVCAAMIGALMGFLMWNWNPARVIMGDTGALFLGGMVVAIAYAIDCPWLIILAGIIYVIEFVSDIIQVFYYKATGKRLFKMAPIHHHFEKSGWSEKKICGTFSLVSVLGGIASIAFVWFGRPQ